MCRRAAPARTEVRAQNLNITPFFWHETHAGPVLFILKDLSCYDATAGLICRPVTAQNVDAFINVVVTHQRGDGNRTVLLFLMEKWGKEQKVLKGLCVLIK